jgi:5-methylcytosine-specific restriction endonuclease McrA
MKPRISLIDFDATKASKFADEWSKVLLDGSERLVGDDWRARKQELWDRAKGQCEYQIPLATGFERCRREGCDAHHIVPRSDGRDDRLTNLQLLCRRHHQLVDPRKTKFHEKV